MPKTRKRQKLRPETKKIILSALSEELKAAGLPSLEEVHDQMEAMLKRPDQHQVEDFASSGVGMGLAWTPMVMFEKQMDELEEPTAVELGAMLKKIKGIRYEIRAVFNEATKKVSKTLLRGLGGRPRKLEPDQYADVCQEVANLLAKRVPLRVAFARVGSRNNVSGRTIQRIWRKRPAELTPENT